MEKPDLETQFVHYKLTNDILFFTYKSGSKITLAIAKEIVKTRLEYINGTAYPTLIKDHGLVSLDKEARDFLSSPEGSLGVTAAALMVHSVFNTFLGNFFLKVTQPKIPAKIFTDQSKALEWLNTYK